MHKALERSIRETLRAANACCQDEHGFLQRMPPKPLVVLAIEFERYLKKHGKAKIKH